MRKMVMISLAMVFVSILSATDVPLDPYGIAVTSNTGNAVQEIEQDINDVRVAPAVGVEDNPFYYTLVILSPAERENARIEIMFMQSVSHEVENYARSIEQTWNSGDYEQALDMLSLLNAMPGVAGNAVLGVAWRTPVQAPMTDWGDDVMISARDSVFALAMDHDKITHNLFAALGFTGDGMGSKFTANFSTDGGSTWLETYVLGGFAYVMNDLDACCVDDWFYIAYTGGLPANPNSMGWLKRYKIADGQQDTFPDGSISFNVYTTTEIMDIDISSNREQSGLLPRLYFYCIDNAGTIHNFWNDPGNTTWTGIATNVNNAQQGLDTDWNVNYTNHSSIMSFITDADSVEIYGRNGTTWENLFTYYIINTPFPDWTTAIGGHNDTLFCGFSYDGTTMQVRYLIRYGLTGGWYYGNIAPDTTVNNWCPDVTLRGSGGIHCVYRGPSTSEAYYRTRAYVGGWSTPVQYNDYTASGELRPQIEFVGNGHYGVLYRRPMASPGYGKCYFDRSDWVTDIVEYKVDDIFGSHISLAPNPTRNLTEFSFATQTQGRIKIALYDIAGRLVSNVMDETMNAGEHSVNIEGRNLAAGVYFVKLETPDGAGTKTMTVVR